MCPVCPVFLSDCLQSLYWKCAFISDAASPPGLLSRLRSSLSSRYVWALHQPLFPALSFIFHTNLTSQSACFSPVAVEAVRTGVLAASGRTFPRLTFLCRSFRGNKGRVCESCRLSVPPLAGTRRSHPALSLAFIVSVQPAMACGSSWERPLRCSPGVPGRYEWLSDFQRYLSNDPLLPDG